MRILVFSERLAPPPDEGIKNFSLSLAEALRGLGHEVLLLTSQGRDWPERGVVSVRAGRLLQSSALKKRIRTFRPDATIYVPTASLTLGSGIRSQMLKICSRRKPMVLAALQGRWHSPLSRRLARLASPDFCLTLSQETGRQAVELGWKTSGITPIVNSRVFSPVSSEEKAALRKNFRIPAEAFVVLHVGHLTASRGIRDLTAITDISYPLLIISPGDSPNEDGIENLKASGVHVVSGYLENIQAFYQIADVYLFPVTPSATAPGSIDFPLSVLEALACNLPVVATRFGALPESWPDCPGILFYDNVEEMRAALARLRHWKGETRELVRDFSGEKVAQKISDLLLNRTENAAFYWAAYLAASWWEGTAAPPGAATDPASVVAVFRANGFPLLSFVNDIRPDATKVIKQIPFLNAQSEDREKLQHQISQFKEVEEKWNEARIPSLFLKALGPSPSFPYTSDNLDVLLPPDRLEEARKLIRDLDYVELRHLEEPHKFLFRRYRSGKISFDLHLHGRIEWHVSFLDDEDVWKHSLPVPDAGATRIPSHEDGILITLAHAVFENKSLQLADLAKVLSATRARRLDWERMEETSRRKGWFPGFLFGLELCILLEKRLYGTAVLQESVPAGMLKGLTRRQKAKADGLAAGLSDLPLRLPFLTSKKLFYRKIWKDQMQSLTARAADAVTHSLRGAKLRLGIRSQKSMLIALDGIDGSGKTTQAQLLADAFRAADIRHRVVWTRGGSSPLLQPAIRTGKRILGLINQPPNGSPELREAERAARFRNPLVRTIWPWLVSFETSLSYLTRITWPLLCGNVVIADRYLLDTLLDLGVLLDNPGIVKTIPASVLRWVSPKPRFHFWLDLSWEEAWERQGRQESSSLLKKKAELAPRLAARLAAERIDGKEPPGTLSDRLVVRVMRAYLDGHKTWLNALFCSNPRPLPKA